MAQSPFQPLTILAFNLEEDPNDHIRVPGSLPLSGGTCTFLCFFSQLRDYCFLHLKKDLPKVTWCISRSMVLHLNQMGSWLFLDELVSQVHLGGNLS